MNEPQPKVAIDGDPATDLKLTIDGREYRRVSGALTWEWRSGPEWRYLMGPEISAVLNALVVELDPCGGCETTVKRCLVARLGDRSGCCPDCDHLRPRRNAPPQEPR